MLFRIFSSNRFLLGALGGIALCLVVGISAEPPDGPVNLITYIQVPATGDTDGLQSLAENYHGAIIHRGIGDDSTADDKMVILEGIDSDFLCLQYRDALGASANDGIEESYQTAVPYVELDDEDFAQDWFQTNPDSSSLYVAHPSYSEGDYLTSTFGQFNDL